MPPRILSKELSSCQMHWTTLARTDKQTGSWPRKIESSRRFLCVGFYFVKIENKSIYKLCQLLIDYSNFFKNCFLKMVTFHCVGSFSFLSTNWSRKSNRHQSQLPDNKVLFASWWAKSMENSCSNNCHVI